MKVKWILPLVVFVWSFSVSHVVFAEQIDNYAVQLNVHTDSSVQVQEQIDYDLGTTWHHGIVRSVPIAQATWFGLRSIGFDVNDIKRDGHSELFTTKHHGMVEDIQIGDENKTIKGQHRYNITYTVNRVLNYDANHAELYWNVVGTDWDVPISRADMRVQLPKNVAKQDVDFKCYIGTANSTTECKVDIDDKGTIHAIAERELKVHEGMTILVHFPVTAVAQPTQLEMVGWWLWDNWTVVIPIVLFPVLFLLWFTKGRDAKGKGTIIAQYEPPKDVLPMLMGTVLDGKVDLRDITGGIIWLAEQGYFTITRIEQKKLLTTATDYQLDLLKPINTIPAGAEQQLAQALFGTDTSIQLSKLQTRSAFSGQLSGVKDTVYSSLVTRGFFRHDPNITRILYSIAGVALGGVLFISSKGDILHIVSGIISGVIVIGFGLIMPAKTKVGAEMKEYILGFKLFLSVTDKERFKFHNAPEKNPQQFMEYLPYAIALGVETQWSDQFKDITIQNPNWYHGGYAGAILASQFAHDMSQFNTQTQSSVRAASYAGTHSSGGVGGGFGGGGGHSW